MVKRDEIDIHFTKSASVSASAATTAAGVLSSSAFHAPGQRKAPQKAPMTSNREREIETPRASLNHHVNDHDMAIDTTTIADITRRMLSPAPTPPIFPQVKSRHVSPAASAQGVPTSFSNTGSSAATSESSRIIARAQSVQPRGQEEHCGARPRSSSTTAFSWPVSACASSVRVPSNRSTTNVSRLVFTCAIWMFSRQCFMWPVFDFLPSTGGIKFDGGIPPPKRVLRGWNSRIQNPCWTVGSFWRQDRIKVELHKRTCFFVFLRFRIANFAKFSCSRPLGARRPIYVATSC